MLIESKNGCIIIHFNRRLKNTARETKMLLKYSHLKYKSSLHYHFTICPCTCVKYIVTLPPVIPKPLSLTLVPALPFLPTHFICS